MNKNAAKPKSLDAFEEWEIAVMKGMIAMELSNEQITAYFTHPERTLNQGRVSDLKTGKRFSSLEAADEATVHAYIEEWTSTNEIVKHVEGKKEPIHPDTLRSLFPLSPSDAQALGVGESDTVEFKSSFGWSKGAREPYFKTAVSFANNKGGYILFGIQDKTKKIVGIDIIKWNNCDVSSIVQNIRKHFSRTIRVTPTIMEVAGKKVGLWHVAESEVKPVVCKTDNGNLIDGAVYFRYSGESLPAKFPELDSILADRDSKGTARVTGLLNKIEQIGVKDTALLDLSTGQVDGEKGSFSIDESLLPKLQFIKEGEFEEESGSATLKLIGTVSTVSKSDSYVRKELNDDGLIEEFVKQRTVPNPTDYIRHLCHTPKIWLPIYYFASMANLDRKELLALLESVKTSKTHSKKRQVARIKKNLHPLYRPNLSSPELLEAQQSLLDGKFDGLDEPERQRKLLKAALSVSLDIANKDPLNRFLNAMYDNGLENLHNSYNQSMFYSAVCYADEFYRM